MYHQPCELSHVVHQYQSIFHQINPFVESILTHQTKDMRIRDALQCDKTLIPSICNPGKYPHLSNAHQSKILHSAHFFTRQPQPLLSFYFPSFLTSTFLILTRVLDRHSARNCSKCSVFSFILSSHTSPIG